MKKALFAFGVTALIASSALVAFADAPQTLTIYCDPDGVPYAVNGVYEPLSSTNCTYMLPAIASSSLVYTFYQGTPGGASLLNISTASSPNAPTTFIQNGVGVGTPPNGTPFFGVAYGWDSFSEVDNANAFFTTGGGTAPLQYFILPFFYGTPLTVTADDVSIAVGAPLPTFTATLSDFIDPDTAADSTTGSASCTTTAADSSDAGDFPITCTPGTLASTKYSFNNFVAGTLHIVAGPPTSPLTVTADNKTTAVGQPLPAFTATLSGFVGADTPASNDVTGSASCTSTAVNSSVAGSFPITCTLGTLASGGHYTFGPFVDGTLTITAAPDTQAPVITITNPLKNGIYAKSDSVFVTATVTDASPLATTTYWLGNKKINPALPLPLSTVSTPSIQTVSVSATDTAGNRATSTVKFFVVKNTNSCLLDIIQILILITQDKTFPDKPTIQNLIADCSALLKGLHRYDDDGHHDGHHH